MGRVGLVLEGGGMRATFTAGILDAFLRAGIYFDYIIGVSAGASNSISYVSRQIGRARTVNVDYLRQYRYCGWRNFFRTGKFMDYDFLFDTVSERLYPLDMDAFEKSPCRYLSVATNCLTGKPAYFEKQRGYARTVAVCRASCSLPVLCPPVFVDGVPYLDGGVCDSIPARRALDDGCEKVVVILTRPRGYRKPARKIRLPFFMYRKYPEFRASLSARNFAYNAQADFLECIESEGRAFTIRPASVLKVGRLESNPDVLQSLYDAATRVCSREFLQKVRDFCA